jgi:cysteine desulfurase/selenocysteine lyase
MIKSIDLQQELDVYAIRRQFPILNREVKDKPLVYLDNAATSQKPQMVIDALANYYAGYNANIHRGIHTLAEEATAAFEATRDTVKQFINASGREEIIFTRGTTESINLVSNTWGKTGTLKQEMRSSFQLWNIIRISFPGKFYVKKKAQR